MRRGRVVGRKGFILDKVEDLDEPALAARILEELYGDEPPLGVPKQVLLPVAPEAQDVYEEWLAIQRHARVDIRVPRRGDKRALLDTVTRNAQEEFTRHRLRRASDHNSRARAINELQDLLGLPEAPLRIECYDMAHLQGTDYVGSMVVMEDGLPKKSDYRRFKVKEVDGNDDYAAMEEVLTRRLTAYLVERDRPIGERGERPGRFSVPAAAARWSTAARASWPWPSGWCAEPRPGGGDPAWRRWPSGSRRSTSPDGPTRSTSPASPRRCSCCSGSATRPTASPTPSTASCGASA